MFGCGDDIAVTLNKLFLKYAIPLSMCYLSSWKFEQKEYILMELRGLKKLDILSLTISNRLEQSDYIYQFDRFIDSNLKVYQKHWCAMILYQEVGPKTNLKVKLNKMPNIFITFWLLPGSSYRWTSFRQKGYLFHHICFGKITLRLFIGDFTIEIPVP